MGRRPFALNALVTLLSATTATTVLPGAAVAAPEQCQALTSLPAVVARASTVGLRVGADGGARGAKAVLNEEGSLLADASKLEAALDACPAGGDEAAQARNKQDTMRAFAALRDEFEYQIGKGIPDPRWPDPDDANDLQLAIKKLGRALEKSVANIG